MLSRPEQEQARPTTTPNIQQLLERAAVACPTCKSRPVTHLDTTVDGKALISGCRSCGLVFRNPLPTRAAIEAYYAPGGGWDRKAERRKHGVEGRRARKAAKRVDPTKSGGWIVPEAMAFYAAGARDVLDVGCEDGRILDKLQAGGWRTSGVDPNTAKVITRHQMLAAIPSEPVADLVIMNHVLEHVRNPLSVLRKARKAIRSDGLLFVGVPTLDGLGNHGMKRYCINRAHITAYTDRSLRNLLGLAGFRLDRRVAVAMPHRMAFVYRPSDTASGLLWPLLPAEIEFRRLAARERGLSAWLRGALRSP